MSCGDTCNPNANRDFEQPVSIENDRIRAQPINLGGAGLCAIHAQTGYLAGKFIIPPNDDLRLLVDLKAGFSLGFTALGYRWAGAHELAPIRYAITTATRPDPRRAVLAKLPPIDEPIVMDVSYPFRMTAVRGTDGTTVFLPAVGAPFLPITVPQLLQGRFDLGPLRYQVVPWPNRPKTKKDVHHLFLAGHLFHYDTCRKHLPGYI